MKMHRVERKVSIAQGERWGGEKGEVRRKGVMERGESVYMRVYSIVSNTGKGMREVGGKVERDIEGEGLNSSKLRRKIWM
jgi:hypothetical protein